MQKYAKHIVVLVVIFFMSVLYFQPSPAPDNTAEVEQPSEENMPSAALINIRPDQHVHEQPTQAPVTIVCLPSNFARHGLDTQMRHRGAQFARTLFLGTPPISHRCYIKFPSSAVHCRNPRIITPEYLQEHGLNPLYALPGGHPGHMCYFKKDMIPPMQALRILESGNPNPSPQESLQENIVKHPHEAIMRIKGQ